MTSAENTRREIVRVIARANPPLVMTLEDIADLTGHSYNYVRNSLQHEPDFPPKLSRFKSPRWARDAVLEWVGVSA
jgi:hypothetical protein